MRQLLQIEQPETVRNSFFDFCLRELKIPRTKGNIHRHCLPDNLTVSILENHAHESASSGRIVVYGFSPKLNLATAGRSQTIEMLHKHCLTSPVAAGQHNKLAFTYQKIYIDQAKRSVLETMREFPDLDHNLTGLNAARSPRSQLTSPGRTRPGRAGTKNERPGIAHYHNGGGDLKAVARQEGQHSGSHGSAQSHLGYRH